MAKLIVFIVIIGFSAIQSIIKAANEKKQRELQARGGRNRQRTVESEIEAFLEGTAAPAPAEDVESTRARERRERRRRQAEARRAEKSRQQKQQRAKQKKQQRPSQRKQQKPQSSRVGSGISEHVNEYISKHVNEYIDNDVEEYVEATIVDNVDENLGERAIEMPGPTVTRHQPNKAAASVRKLLNDPTGVRNAILVNEILSRPRALRK